MKRKKVISVIALILVIIMVFSFVLSAVANAEGDDTSFEDELARLNEEKETAHRNVTNAQNKIDTLKAEQALIIEEKIALEERNAAAREEIELIEKQIDVISNQIDSYNVIIAEKEQEVIAAKEKEDDQLKKYRERLRAIEESGGYNFLSFIMNADSLGKLLFALDDYSNVMESDVQLYEQLQAARDEYEKIVQEYIDLKEACEEEKEKYTSELNELNEDKKELEQKIADSEAEIEDYNEKIKEAEEEQERMEALEAAASAAISGFMQNYYNKKKEEQTASNTTTVETSASEGNTENITESATTETEQQETVYQNTETEQQKTVYQNTETEQQETVYQNTETEQQPAVTGSGYFCWPFPGHYSVTSEFGYRASTGSFHSGIDIDGYASMGSPIIAADSGTVILAQYYGGYGNCIIIDHGNGYSTLYAHLSSMYYGVGSYVTQGTTIGGFGNTGTCYGIDGIHLHFEVMINGVQVDPRGYV